MGYRTARGLLEGVVRNSWDWKTIDDTTPVPRPASRRLRSPPVLNSYKARMWKSLCHSSIKKWRKQFQWEDDDSIVVCKNKVKVLESVPQILKGKVECVSNPVQVCSKEKIVHVTKVLESSSVISNEVICSSSNNSSSVQKRDSLHCQNAHRNIVHSQPQQRVFQPLQKLRQKLIQTTKKLFVHFRFNNVQKEDSNKAKPSESIMKSWDRNTVYSKNSITTTTNQNLVFDPGPYQQDLLFEMTTHGYNTTLCG